MSVSRNIRTGLTHTNVDIVIDIFVLNIGFQRRIDVKVILRDHQED